MDEVVLHGLFRSCPALERVVAFGCFGIGVGLDAAGDCAGDAATATALTVPRGVVLIGVPRAQDAIEQFGMGFDGVDGGVDGGVDRSRAEGEDVGEDSAAMAAQPAATLAASVMVDVAA